MRIRDLLHQRLGFTRSEIVVVGLLCAGLMAGTAVRAFRQTPAGQRVFPYAAADSAFLRGARALHSEMRPRADAGAAHAAPTPVDINTASAPELIALPGIGPSMAGRILAYRAAHGKFTHVEDLDRVKGIGPATVRRLRPFIRIGTMERHH
jgi:competence ComEA-like helix-hairpin-helix protein